MESERKEVGKQTYTVTITHYDNETSIMRRVNDGFNALELIGLGDLITMDVRDQIRGDIKPTIIDRIHIKQSE